MSFRRHHYIGGLHIAMNDSRGVGLCERVGDLHSIAQDFVKTEPIASDQLVDRLPGDQLHREIVGSIVVADVVNRNDVVMV